MSRVELNNNKISVNDNHSWTCYVNEGSNFMLSAYYGYGNADITIIPTPNTENVYGSVTFTFNVRPCQITYTIEVNGLTAPYLNVNPKVINFTKKGQTVDIFINTSTSGDTTISKVEEQNYFDIVKNGITSIPTVLSLTNDTFHDKLIKVSNDVGVEYIVVNQECDENDVMAIFEITPHIITLQGDEKTCRVYITSIYKGELYDYSIGETTLSYVKHDKYVDFELPHELTANTQYEITFSRDINGSIETLSTKINYTYIPPKISYLYWGDTPNEDTIFEYEFTTVSSMTKTFKSSSRCSITKQSEKASAIIQSLGGDNYQLVVNPKDFHEIRDNETIILTNKDNNNLTFSYTIVDGLVHEEDYKFHLSSTSRAVVEELQVEDAYNKCVKYYLESKERDTEEEWYLKSINYVQYVLKQYKDKQWVNIDKGVGSGTVYIGGSLSNMPSSSNDGDYWIYSETLTEVSEAMEAHFRLVQDESYKEIDVACQYTVMTQAEMIGITVIADPMTASTSGDYVTLECYAKYDDGQQLYLSPTENQIEWVTYNGTTPELLSSETKWYIEPNPNYSDNKYDVVAKFNGFTASTTITQSQPELGDDKYIIILTDEYDNEVDISQHQSIPYSGGTYTFTVILNNEISGQLNITKDPETKISINNEVISNSVWVVNENTDYKTKEFNIEITYQGLPIANEITASQETPYEFTELTLVWADTQDASGRTNDGNLIEYNVEVKGIYSHKYDSKEIIVNLNNECEFITEGPNQLVENSIWHINENDTLESIEHKLTASWSGYNSNTLIVTQTTPYTVYDIDVVMEANGQTLNYEAQNCPFEVNLIYIHNDNSGKTKSVTINTDDAVEYNCLSNISSLSASVNDDKTVLLIPENDFWFDAVYTFTIRYEDFSETITITQSSPYSLDRIDLSFVNDVSQITYQGGTYDITVKAIYKHVNGTEKEFPTPITEDCQFEASDGTSYDSNTSRWSVSKNMDMVEKTHTLTAIYSGKNDTLTVKQTQPFTLNRINMYFVDHADVKGIEVESTSGSVKYGVSAIYVNQNDSSITSSITITKDCEYTIVNGESSIQEIGDGNTYQWTYQENTDTKNIVHNLQAKYEDKTDNLFIDQKYLDNRNYEADMAFYSSNGTLNNMSFRVDFVSSDGGGALTSVERVVENSTLYPFQWMISNMPYYVQCFGEKFTEGGNISNYWSNGKIRVSIPIEDGKSFMRLGVSLSGYSPEYVETYSTQTDWSETVDVAEFPTSSLNTAFGIDTYERFVDELMKDGHNGGCDTPISFIIDYGNRIIPINFQVHNETAYDNIDCKITFNFTLKLTDGSEALYINMNESATLNGGESITHDRSTSTSGATMGYINAYSFNSSCGTYNSYLKKCQIYVSFIDQNGKGLGNFDWDDKMQGVSGGGSIQGSDGFNLADVKSIQILCYLYDYI